MYCVRWGATDQGALDLGGILTGKHLTEGTHDLPSSLTPFALHATDLGKEGAMPPKVRDKFVVQLSTATASLVRLYHCH